MAEYLAPALDGADIANTVEANGLELAYEQFGRDRDPAVVLIAGLGLQLVAWPDAFCRVLADAGLRVIRFDNRDAGYSTKFHASRGYDKPWRAFLKARLGRSVRTAYTLADMARDTLGLMDALRIEQAHLVGSSMGSMIAQMVAVSHASRVASLTSLMSTTHDRKLPRARLKILKRLIKKPKGRNLEAIAAHSARTMMLVGSPKIGRSYDDWEQEMRLSLERNYYPEGKTRQILAVLAGESRVDKLRALRCPALVVHGDIDPLIPVAHGRATANAIPNARYEEVRGMGHDLPPSLLPRLARWITDMVWQAERSTGEDDEPAPLVGGRMAPTL